MVNRFGRSLEPNVRQIAFQIYEKESLHGLYQATQQIQRMPNLGSYPFAPSE